MDTKGKSTYQEPPRYHVRLPGFVVSEQVGLGDAVTRVTRAVGIRPCGGCARRAASLNQWLRFSPTAWDK
jgi:hypothetical protein